MHVILHAANDQSLYLRFASDAAEVGPKAGLQFGINKWMAVFSGPHAMH